MDPERETEDIEIRLLLEAVYAKYGYDFRGYALASIRRRVQAALATSGAPNLGELQHRLLTDASVFARVLEGLTIQVTDMFRDSAFYRTFRDQVIPVLRTYPQIKIWHAGCASGEEVYATAILLTEEGLYDRTQLYATDLSVEALGRAREGVYTEERARTFTENYKAAGGAGSLEAYYSVGYGRIAIKDVLRKNILFFQHDLVSDHAFGEMQVVFCRNVMIYFGAELRERIVAKLGQSLCRGGFLCLGSSERLAGSPEEARFDRFAPRESIYRLRAGA